MIVASERGTLVAQWTKVHEQRFLRCAILGAHHPNRVFTSPTAEDLPALKLVGVRALRGVCHSSRNDSGLLLLEFVATLEGGDPRGGEEVLRASGTSEVVRGHQASLQASDPVHREAVARDRLEHGVRVPGVRHSA